MKIKISENSKLRSCDRIPFLSESDGHEIHVNPTAFDDIYDAWFVFGDLPRAFEVTKLKSNNVFFFECETAYADTFYKKMYVKRFYKQFSNIFGFSRFVKDSDIEPPFLPWMLDFNHGYSAFNTEYSYDMLRQMNFEVKKKKISVICSDKVETNMQRQRLEFVKQLKIKLGDELDWFGAGINPIEKKIDGLSDYEFSLCIENVQRKNIFSEKLIDPILTNTVPIYVGAPNIADYFDIASILQLKTLSNVDIDEIVTILNERHYSEFTTSLRKNKERCLNQQNWLKRAIAKLDYYAVQSADGVITRILANIRTNKIITGGL